MGDSPGGLYRTARWFGKATMAMFAVAIAGAATVYVLILVQFSDWGEESEPEPTEPPWNRRVAMNPADRAAAESAAERIRAKLERLYSDGDPHYGDDLRQAVLDLGHSPSRVKTRGNADEQDRAHFWFGARVAPTACVIGEANAFELLEVEVVGVGAEFGCIEPYGEWELPGR